MINQTNFIPQQFYSYSPHKTNPKISFGTTYRFYQSESGDTISCYTCPFRGDISWPGFVDFIKNNFKKKDKVNIINAACSDGSEPYSLAIMMKERLTPAENKKFMPIKAYDIDKEIIEIAKTGCLSVSNTDMYQINQKSKNKYIDINFDQDSLNIPNDGTQNARNVVKLKEELTRNVVFETKDVMNILENLEDDSNTILMFRNALGHLDDEFVNQFANLASEKLKSGSVLVVGNYDIKNTNISELLKEHGFEKIMHNVYRKEDVEGSKKTLGKKLFWFPQGEYFRFKKSSK